jgi:hypothetical protein
MKNILHLISYLHKLSRIFIPFLYIFRCEKPISGFILNEKTCRRWGLHDSGPVAARRALIGRPGRRPPAAARKYKRRRSGKGGPHAGPPCLSQWHLTSWLLLLCCLYTRMPQAASPQMLRAKRLGCRAPAIAPP